jgi:hypothetical protein
LDFCLENMRYNDDEINTVNFVNVQEWLKNITK